MNITTTIANVSLTKVKDSLQLAGFQGGTLYKTVGWFSKDNESITEPSITIDLAFPEDIKSQYFAWLDNFLRQVQEEEAYVIVTRHMREPFPQSGEYIYSVKDKKLRSI